MPGGAGADPRRGPCQAGGKQTYVYLNIADRLRVDEPAAGMAIAAAISSAAFDKPTGPGAVYFGEIGLAGEIRQVAQPEARRQEAVKLGFYAASQLRRLAL
jgi:DNA repair protein RadA/Sms